MKGQRLLLALTLVNFGLLACAWVPREMAGADDVVPVLRGRALEIVDERGRVRASISVLPADPTTKMPDGTTGYPETVLLRLITSEGRPNVKLGTGESGSGLLLGGKGDPTYVQILAEGGSTSLKLLNQNGREHVIQP